MAKHQTKIDDSHNLPLLPILLPSVAFEDRDKLPQTSGIYFALGTTGEVLYVGKSQNIHDRWKQHHQQINLRTLNCAVIGYYVCSLDDLQLIERSMILQFVPPLNGHTGRPRTPGPTFVEVRLDVRSGSMTPAQFIGYLKEQICIHGSQKAFAKHYGIGEAFLSDVLRGRRDAGPKLLNAMGFEKVIRIEETIA